MKLKHWALGLAVIAGFAANDAARADELTIGAGTWQTLRSKYITSEVDADYVSGVKFWIFQPHAGVLVAGDGDYYAYGGLLADFALSSHLYFTFKSAIGGYGGDGYKLGSHFEFRNGGDLGYKFDNDWRVGVGFYHISNAGITKLNGGSESTLLQITAPLPW